jgi:septal ring factor EnvC (AmiA/AmiB activator)
VKKRKPHILLHLAKERIAGLESEIISLRATAEADAQVNAQLHDELRAKKIDVNSAALTDANKRIAELERELEECKHDIERHIAIVEELERERDEARRLARVYRTVAAMDNPPELPWEEGE